MTELPAEARRDRDSFDLFGTKSAVYVPLSVGKGPVFGVLGFVVTRGERDWPRRVVQQFQLVAQIFANALSRQQAEKSLEERLRFEMLLADISARFVNLPSGQIDGAIADAQRHVCECLGLDLSALWQWSTDAPGLLTMTHIYRALEGPQLPEPMDAQEYFPWCRQQLEEGKIVSLSSMAELPAEAIRDRETWLPLRDKELFDTADVGGGWASHRRTVLQHRAGGTPMAGSNREAASTGIADIRQCARPEASGTRAREERAKTAPDHECPAGAHRLCQFRSALSVQQ